MEDTIDFLQNGKIVISGRIYCPETSEDRAVVEVYRGSRGIAEGVPGYSENLTNHIDGEFELELGTDHGSIFLDFNLSGPEPPQEEGKYRAFLNHSPETLEAIRGEALRYAIAVLNPNRVENRAPDPAKSSEAKV